jgi:hypothetical protein
VLNATGTCWNNVDDDADLQGYLRQAADLIAASQ